MKKLEYPYLIRITESEFEALWAVATYEGDEEPITDDMKKRLASKALLMHGFMEKSDSLKVSNVLLDCFVIMTSENVIKISNPDTLKAQSELVLYRIGKRHVATVRSSGYIELMLSDTYTCVIDVLKNMIMYFAVPGDCDNKIYKSSKVPETFDSDFKKADKSGKLFMIYLQNLDKSFSIFPKSGGGAWSFLSDTKNGAALVCHGTFEYCQKLLLERLSKLIN